jgi:hypothetical protein
MKLAALFLFGATAGWFAREWVLTRWKWCSAPPETLEPRKLALRHLFIGLWLALLVAMLAGCTSAPAPLRGGAATIGKAITAPFKAAAPTAGDATGKPLPPLAPPATEGMSLAQPDNPATPAQQSYKATRTETIEFAAPARIITETAESRVIVEIPQGSKSIVTETREAGQQIGAAQKDTARADAAWLASFKGVQALGTLVFLAGVFCFAHPVGRRVIGGKDTAVVMALAGLVMIFGPALLQRWGNWFAVVIVLVAAHWFYSRSKYKEGRLDELEKVAATRPPFPSS